MNRALSVMCSLLVIVTACASTDPNTIEVRGQVASLRGSIGDLNGLSVLVTNATFTNPDGLASPINIVVGPATQIYFSKRHVAASEIELGAFITAIVGGNVLDSQPQYISASRIDISNVVSASRQVH